MLPQRSHKDARHVTRKRGVYYFRRRLPGCGIGEIALSLQTRNFRAAEWLAGLLSREFDRIVTKMSTDKNRIAEALRKYLEVWLAEDQTRWLGATAGRPVYAWDFEEGNDPVAADLAAIEQDIKDARLDAAQRNLGAVSEAADEIITQNGLSPADHAAIAYGILQARVRVFEARRERALGNPLPLIPQPPPAAVPPPAHVNGAPAPQPVGPLFSELLPQVLKFGSDEKGWRGQTLAQSETSLHMFVEVCGDKPVSSYTRRDTGTFYDLLRELPALWSKDKRWRGKPLSQVVADVKDKPEVERMTMKTIKRHFSALGVFFRYAKKRGLIEAENPAYGFDFPTTRDGRKARDVWSDEALKKLFASPIWTGRHPTFRSKAGDQIIRDAFFWLPILALHHGNRLEEFAQLQRRDIGQEDGIWYFDLTDDAGRKLKNQQSRRRVPMHPVMITLGFLDYVESTAPRPDGPIFPDLEPGGPDKRRGFTFTKRWTEYRRNIGVYDAAQDYHSFRHTVITKLAALNVSQDIRETIAGHAGSGVNAKVYRKGNRIPLNVLHDALSRLDWSSVSPLFATVTGDQEHHAA